MNEEHKHNDPIERLFREKADEYDISYREEDWLKLEKKLEARDLRRYYRRRLHWLAAASILLISLIGYYTYQNHSKLNQLAEQLNQDEFIEERESLTDEQLNSDIQPENSTVSPQDQQQSPDVNNSSAGDTDLDAGNLVQNMQAEGPGLIVNETEFFDANSEHFAEAAQIISRKPLDQRDLFSNKNASVLSAYEPIGYPHSGGESLNVSDIYYVTDDRSSESSIFLRDEREQNYQSVRSRLALGVVISPDLSTVGSVSNFYNPGLKGGIVVEYAISKNLSLVSGLAVSNVKYKASGNEYNPPQAWNYGIMPDQTTAVCMVLDIPVNLKANIFNFEKSRFFVTAGLSSYIMLNEDYQFRYKGDASGLQASWSERTGTRHWLSNAGFSVGFEYDLSSKWSLRAEPHIKIPLKGVGWGDVRLYSVGNFISLNYRFDR